jgi:hypothetical protein
MKFTKVIDQYDKVSGKARVIMNLRKPSTKLAEDYKRALRVLGEM